MLTLQIISCIFISKTSIAHENTPQNYQS
ncbi:hypothetical protein LINPERHAP1_LOCUS14844 [Linum perenne]